MYIAINKANPQEFHNFTWTEDDKLIVNGNEVNPNDWDIVEVIRQNNSRIFTLTKN